MFVVRLPGSVGITQTPGRIQKVDPSCGLIYTSWEYWTPELRVLLFWIVLGVWVVAGFALSSARWMRLHYDRVFVNTYQPGRRPQIKEQVCLGKYLDALAIQAYSASLRESLAWLGSSV